MDFENFLIGSIVFGLALIMISLSFFIGFAIYKEYHCWGLDAKTAPIECQITNTINVNGLDLHTE